MGARVIACASSEDKLAFCRELGADETINYSEVSLKEALKEATGGKGADVVYDPVGGDLAEEALRGTAWEGPVPRDRFRQRKQSPRSRLILPC